MTLNIRHSLSCIVAAVVTLVLPAAFAQEIRSPGTLYTGNTSSGIVVTPKAGWSLSAAVSDGGSVAAGWSFADDWKLRAFRWTEAGMVNLGTLEGGESSEAWSMSADGSVVVGGSDASDIYQAMRWTAADGMQGLGTLPGGDGSFAWGVSDDGTTVVGESDSTDGWRAFRWTDFGGMQNLGVLFGGTESFATAANEDGSVVVGWSDSSAGVRAFRWTAATGMVDLGTVPDSTYSEANAVSADGSVVVGSSITPDGYHLFRWTQASGMEDLGLIPPDGRSAWVRGISHDGQIVLGRRSFLPRGLIWSEELGFVDLEDHLSAHGIDLTEWNNLRAMSISRDGTAIGGQGEFNGVPLAFIADLRTQVGSDVVVAITLDNGAEIQITFEEVLVAGVTSASATEPGATQSAPMGFMFGNPPVLYQVETTAEFTGTIEICFTWEEGQFVNEQNMQLFHSQSGESGGWTDVTTSVDPEGRVICGEVTGFSYFGLFTPTAETLPVAWEIRSLGAFHPDHLQFQRSNGWSLSTAISNDGSVVAGWSHSEEGMRAFRWKKPVMENLGALNLGNQNRSEAWAMSADGSVIVGRSAAIGSGEAMRWTAANGMQGLGALSGGNASFGWGVSDDGSTVVGESDSTDGWRAFRWTEAAGMQDLGVLTGHTRSGAWAANEDGSVVVGWSAPSGGPERRAIRWTAATGMVDLGTVPNGTSSDAHAVSADGSVVVGSSLTPDGHHLFRWSEGSGMEDLGLIAPSGESAWVRGISDDGTIVLSPWAPASLHVTPEIWSEGQGFVDLETYLSVRGVDLTGWSNLYAMSISRDGSAIGGQGELDGVSVAFIANRGESSNTQVGADVVVATTLENGADVQITFEEVLVAGVTSASATEPGATQGAPMGFMFGNPPMLYQIETTAEFTGTVEICFTWEEGQFVNEQNMQLFHSQSGESGGWTDVTTSVDPEGRVICGEVTGFSYLGLFEPTAAMLLEMLIDEVTVLNLHHGINTSLDAKLGLVAAALTSVRNNAEIIAIHALHAFIYEVQAQSGTHITVEEAAGLIASAEAIIAVLSEP